MPTCDYVRAGCEPVFLTLRQHTDHSANASLIINNLFMYRSIDHSFKIPIPTLHIQPDLAIPILSVYLHPPPVDSWPHSAVPHPSLRAASRATPAGSAALTSVHVGLGKRKTSLSCTKYEFSLFLASYSIHFSPPFHTVWLTGAFPVTPRKP